jgi:hypothetical protein
MKTLLGAAFGALLLSGAVMAQAATAGNPADAGVLVAQAASTPFTYGNGNSQAMPVFNDQRAVPVTATIPLHQNSGAARFDGTLRLLNETGGR